MTDAVQIPLEVVGARAALDALERVQGAVRAVGDAGTDAGGSLADTATRVAGAYTLVSHAVGDVVSRVREAVEWAARQVDAANRVAAAEATLGLSMDTARRYAGGYVDAMQGVVTAQTLAERGIRVTQAELNALMRIGQSYARTTGKQLEEVMENLAETVTEGGEELGKFDVALLRVADTAQFTAEDRLRALVERAGQMAPAAETLEDRLRALDGALESLASAFATATVDAMSPFLASATDASERMEALRNAVHGVGGAVGTVLGMVASGVEGIGRLIAMAIQGLVGVARTGWAGLEALVHLRDPSRAMSAAADAAAAGLRAQWAELDALGERIAAAWDDRTSAAAAATPTLADVRRDRAARRARTGGGGGSGSGGGGGSNRTADMVFSAEEAERGVNWREDEAEARLREAEARFAREARAREDARVEELLSREREEEERIKTRQRQQEEREKTLALEADFNARFRDLHQERVQIAESAAQSVDAALRSVGDSLARHWERVIAGQESVSEALRGLLSDTLAALAREAYAKSAFYAAEGLARLVIGDLAGAGTAFAASAAYLAAGTGAQALGGAVGGAERPSGAGGAAAGADRPAGAQEAPRDTGGVVVVHQYYAPVIGGRAAGPEEVGRAVERYAAQESQRRVSL